MPVQAKSNRACQPKEAVTRAVARDDSGSVSFRGDSKWLGLNKLGNSDTLMGLSTAGFLYVLSYDSGVN